MTKLFKSNQCFVNIMTKSGALICVAVVCLILLLRLTSLGSYDLYDKTEARYAGIAMRMAESNNFITPYIEPSIPFLAKPPLSFWITAASFKMFGINEFAARLPHFLFGVFLVMIVYAVFYKLYDFQRAIILATILVSTPAFIGMLGMVMTESVLIFCISVSMLSAWIRLEKNGSILCSYMFFIALGLSMLAKGPIGVVMIVIPLTIYLTIYKKWFFFFKKFNIITGFLLSTLIFLPWYIMEEIRNPGFLHYFLFGEHLGRFLISGWKGDLYGHAHNQPLGMMLLYFVVSTVPWIFYPIMSFVYKPYTLLQSKPSVDVVFFSCFAFFPIIFFIVARNIILSYGMFCIVPFSILILYFFEKNGIKKLLFFITTSLCPILIICVMSTNFLNIMLDNSDKKYVQFVRMNSQNDVLYFKTKIEYSSRFYSGDRVKLLENEKELEQLSDGTLIVIGNEALNSIESKSFRRNLKQVMCDSKNYRCLYMYHNE